MKKLVALLLSSVVIFTLAACGSTSSGSESDMAGQLTAAEDGTETTESISESETEPDTETETGNILIAYFSHTGNTAEVATLISEYTGGEMVEIQRTEAYGDLNEKAEAEINDGVRPEITMPIDNIDDYDTIFVGYPIWWNEAPAMIASFLENYDFEGKTIIPFCTSASDTIDNSLHIFREICPDATLASGLTAINTEDIRPWLERLGLLKGNNESAATTQISITSGETTVYAELNHTEIAQEFAATLPQTLSMQRVGGGREFYGGMDGSLNYDEADAQTTFENGDLAYWFSGNGFCILYNNQVDEPEIESGIILLGKITSDFSVFYEMENYIEVTIELVE